MNRIGQMEHLPAITIESWLHLNAFSGSGYHLREGFRMLKASNTIAGGSAPERG